MAECATETIWRSDKSNKWLLFNNNSYQLPPLVTQDKNTKDKDAITKKDKKDQKSAFYFAKIKAETKGSLVYTPKGYGIVQALKPDQISVKVNNEIHDFGKNDIISEIPISLTFIASSGKREDKAVLPIHSTAKDIVERIEGECDSDTLSSRIFFMGKEINKSNESLEKMGVIPLSKFLVIAAMGKPMTVSRFSCTYQGWGYSQSSIDAISFTASRDIRVIGFGIYTPDNDVMANGIAKFIQGNDVKGQILYTRDVNVSKNLDNPEDKVYKFMFNRPIKVKAGDSYSCCVELKNGNTHYGSGGNTMPMGEGDVSFTIAECIGSTNGTGPTSGQVPEIYYYV